MKKIIFLLLLVVLAYNFSMEAMNYNPENEEYLLNQAQMGYENCEGFAKFALLTFGLGTIVLAPKWDCIDNMDNQTSQSDWCYTNTLRKMFGTGCLLLGSWAGRQAWQEHKRYKKYVFELKKS